MRLRHIVRGSVHSAAATAVFACISVVSVLAEEGGPGITEPRVLPTFDEGAAACLPPDGLTQKLVFAQDNRREFVAGIDVGLRHAARDRGLEYQAIVADNDAGVQATQLRTALGDATGAVVVSPVDPASINREVQELLWKGAYVGSVVPPPATLILNAPQYLTGKALGDEAAAYIKDHLGGQAVVVLLTQDSIQFLAPRFRAIRDSLRALPGVKIVADISPSPVSKEGGFRTMSIVLEAHPRVDVVLGADAVVLGALEALRGTSRDRPDQFLGGIDGEPEAVSEIREGGPYKTSVALASPIFGYAMGAYAADWLEGKSIPQAMDILPIALTAENLRSYEADLGDPAAVFRDETRRSRYLQMFGNICFETRDQYLNFPWSSEATP
jgi:ribose transport system substrate-binding protein